MTTFKMDHAVTVKNVNGGNEHHGDVEKLLATLSLQGSFPVEEIQAVFGIDEMDVESFKKVFWDDKGNRRTEKDHSMKLDFALKELHLEILVDQATAPGAKKQIFVSNEARVKDFSYQFTVGHQVMMKFSAQALVSEDQRDEGQMDKFYEYLHKGIYIKIEPVPTAQGDMLED